MRWIMENLMKCAFYSFVFTFICFIVITKYFEAKEEKSFAFPALYGIIFLAFCVLHQDIYFIESEDNIIKDSTIEDIEMHVDDIAFLTDEIYAYIDNIDYESSPLYYIDTDGLYMPYYDDLSDEILYYFNDAKNELTPQEYNALYDDISSYINDYIDYDSTIKIPQTDEVVYSSIKNQKINEKKLEILSLCKEIESLLKDHQ